MERRKTFCNCKNVIWGKSRERTNLKVFNYAFKRTKINTKSMSTTERKVIEKLSFVMKVFLLFCFVMKSNVSTLFQCCLSLTLTRKYWSEKKFWKNPILSDKYLFCIKKMPKTQRKYHIVSHLSLHFITLKLFNSNSLKTL